MKRVLTIAAAALGLPLVALLAMTLYYIGVTANVRLDMKKLATPPAYVRIFDAEGVELPAAAAVNACSKELPAHVGQAFIAVEDKRFYSHHGIDTRRMFAALFKNITTFSFQEGASTITQQLIKNTHLSGERPSSAN